MARAALAQLDLEKILWMPTGDPRYRQAPVAPAEHRVAMLRIALESEGAWEIDTREIAPGASGYTVDTLLELRLELGRETALVLLIGADQHDKLGAWHRPDEIKRLAKIAVFQRPGFGKQLGKETLVVEMQPMTVSGSEIRARLACGDSIDGMVPAAVAGYIAEHGLYRAPH
jgi:nicotinate-nucleotide adenylyltransferase